MSSYTDFNFWVFNYYKDHNVRGEVGCLAIDEYDYRVSSFKGIYFKEINQDSWLNLLKLDVKHKIPLYFGLIGLQCLATTVVDDNIIREAFKEIAGIQNLKFADNSFKENFNKTTIQDELWIRAKSYLEEKYCIFIEIPQPRAFKDRYLQYPKSQVLLNKNDLTEYIPVFEKINEKFEVISIEFLTQEIKKFNLTFHTKNNKNDELVPSRQQIKYQQVFNYYNSDDWQNDLYRKKVYKKLTNSLNNSYIYLENEVIQLFNSDDLEITPLELLSVYGDFCFFKEHSIFEDEFERTDYLEWDETYIILYKKSFSYGKTISGKVILQEDYFGFNIIFFKENEPVEPYIFNQYFQLVNEKISLEGIRIGRRNIFLQNLGPKIICANSYSVYYENLLIDYSRDLCIVGNYRIKRAGYSDIKFEIVHYCIFNIENKDLESSHGWRVDNFSFDNKGTRLIGAKFIEDKSISKQELTINRWVTANSTISSPEHNQYLTLLSNYLDGK